ncbi:hypothetical protein, partial [Enterococcus cecorum]|uniref:hypothetical protein n=1 Tax=Enterococcus cecorum TaxID=44008 RepID=UPI002ACBDBF6
MPGVFLKRNIRYKRISDFRRNEDTAIFRFVTEIFNTSINSLLFRMDKAIELPKKTANIRVTFAVS